MDTLSRGSPTLLGAHSESSKTHDNGVPKGNGPLENQYWSVVSGGRDAAGGLNLLSPCRVS